MHFHKVVVASVDAENRMSKAVSPPFLVIVPSLVASCFFAPVPSLSSVFPCGPVMQNKYKLYLKDTNYFK
jgi:hypothetical protein